MQDILHGNVGSGILSKAIHFAEFFTPNNIIGGSLVTDDEIITIRNQIWASDPKNNPSPFSCGFILWL